MRDRGIQRLEDYLRRHPGADSARRMLQELNPPITLKAPEP